MDPNVRFVLARRIGYQNQRILDRQTFQVAVTACEHGPVHGCPKTAGLPGRKRRSRQAHGAGGDWFQARRIVGNLGIDAPGATEGLRDPPSLD